MLACSSMRIVFKGEANARLIAAAPELYTELKACIQNLTMAMLVMDAEARAVCMQCITPTKSLKGRSPSERRTGKGDTPSYDFWSEIRLRMKHFRPTYSHVRGSRANIAAKENL